MERKVSSETAKKLEQKVFVPTPLIMRVLLWSREVSECVMPIGIMDGRLARELGYTPHELVGRDFVDLVYDLARERDIVRETLTTFEKMPSKTTFLRTKAGNKSGPYNLDFIILRKPNESKRGRPCVAVNVVSCSNSAILLKLQHFFVNTSSSQNSNRTTSRPAGPPPPPPPPRPPPPRPYYSGDARPRPQMGDQYYSDLAGVAPMYPPYDARWCPPMPPPRPNFPPPMPHPYGGRPPYFYAAPADDDPSKIPRLAGPPPPPPGGQQGHLHPHP